MSGKSILVTVAMAVATVAVSSQSGGGVRPAPGFTESQEFLFLVYPDLMGRMTQWTSSVAGSGNLVSISDAQAAPAAVDARVPPLLDALIDFDETGRLRSFRAFGSLVAQAENVAYAESLRVDTRVTEADALSLLPKRAAARSVGSQLDIPGKRQPERWIKYLGSGIRVAAPLLRLRSDPATNESVLTPGWTVAVTALDRERTVQYQFRYEPITGRLVSVVRR